MIVENEFYWKGEFYFFVAKFSYFKEGTEYFLDEVKYLLVDDKNDKPVNDEELFKAIENSIEDNLRDYV